MPPKTRGTGGNTTDSEASADRRVSQLEDRVRAQKKYCRISRKS